MASEALSGVRSRRYLRFSLVDLELLSCLLLPLLDLLDDVLFDKCELSMAVVPDVMIVFLLNTNPRSSSVTNGTIHQ